MNKWMDVTTQKCTDEAYEKIKKEAMEKEKWADEILKVKQEEWADEKAKLKEYTKKLEYMMYDMLKLKQAYKQKMNKIKQICDECE